MTLYTAGQLVNLLQEELKSDLSVDYISHD